MQMERDTEKAQLDRKPPYREVADMLREKILAGKYPDGKIPSERAIMRYYGVSRNHIMFGDFSAWAFEFLAGIRIVEPGFDKVEIRPHLPDGVESFDIRHRTPHGEILIRAACRSGAGPVFHISVPAGVVRVSQPC